MLPYIDEFFETTCRSIIDEDVDYMNIEVDDYFLEICRNKKPPSICQEQVAIISNMRSSGNEVNINTEHLNALKLDRPRLIKSLKASDCMVPPGQETNNGKLIESSEAFTLLIEIKSEEIP